MREIKFRAWDIIRKEYVNLNEVMSSIPYYELFCHTPDSLALNLEQFTGLKDRDCVDIYEGDILRVSGSVAEVKYRPDIAAFEGFTKLGPTVLSSRMILKIIGNIHENKELLANG